MSNGTHLNTANNFTPAPTANSSARGSRGHPHYDFHALSRRSVFSASARNTKPSRYPDQPLRAGHLAFDYLRGAPGFVDSASSARASFGRRLHCLSSRYKHAFFAAAGSVREAFSASTLYASKRPPKMLSN